MERKRVEMCWQQLNLFVVVIYSNIHIPLELVTASLFFLFIYLSRSRGSLYVAFAFPFSFSVSITIVSTIHFLPSSCINVTDKVFFLYSDHYR